MPKYVAINVGGLPVPPPGGEPANPLGNPGISPVGAAGVDVQLGKNQNSENSFIKNLLPLSTRKEEIQGFIRSIKESLGNDDKVPERYQRISISADPQDAIASMDFEVYWQFRQFQINNLTELFAERLRLRAIPDPTDQDKIMLENVDSTLNQLMDRMYAAFPRTAKIKEFLLKGANAVGGFFGIDPIEQFTLEQRREYLERLMEFYKGISIKLQDEDPNSRPPKPRQVDIQKTDQNGTFTLVTCVEDFHNNKMTFKIPQDIIDGQDQTRLEHAICLMMDQATRTREKSWDLTQTISGWHNRPDIALRIYQLAILNGSKPVMSEDTLNAWDEKANSTTDPKANEFKKARELFAILREKYDSDPPIGGADGLFRKKLMELQTIKHIQEYLKPKPTSPVDPHAGAAPAL